MSELSQWLAEVKVLDDTARQVIKKECGQQGEKALAAIDSHRVKKYLDFFVVEGKTGEYVVDEDFCTCRDFIFRNRECWHLLAVRIAQTTGTFEEVERWYQDRWKDE
jgi:predicted nucleic acid-binding Zn finger protein